jgi:hypothetical protein
MAYQLPNTWVRLCRKSSGVSLTLWNRSFDGPSRLGRAVPLGVPPVSEKNGSGPLNTGLSSHRREPSRNSNLLRRGQAIPRRYRPQTAQKDGPGKRCLKRAASWRQARICGKLSANLGPHPPCAHHEDAGFELYDPKAEILVRQSEDFPLGRVLLSSLPSSPDRSPGGQAERKRASLIFSKHQMQDFEDEVAKSFLAEGLRSL